jgi:CBS domain-containing protein
MTATPRTVNADDRIVDAARAMAEGDVGSVVVMRDNEVCGIVTDRDIAVRAVAKGLDPTTAAVDEITSHELTTIHRDTSVDDAVELMRSRSIRRLPVVDGGRPVGIVSIGDLAVERDTESALADISSEPPNN